MSDGHNDKPFNEMARIFADEDAARDYLEEIRWGADGPTCPRCGNIGAYALKGKSTRHGLYKCAACRKPFTVTVGTVFERSHVPLNKWVYALHLMCESKKGVSANQLCRSLDVTYKTAWFMCHRIRKAMESDAGIFNKPQQVPPQGRLDGHVEADETYIGGKGKPGGPTAGGKKAIVFTLVSRDGDARSFHVDNVKAVHLQGIIARNVEGGAHISTDEMHSYRGLDVRYEHGSVNHHKGEYVRGIVSTNFAESYFSLLKRGIIGIFHHVSKTHLQRYLEEFDFRWSRRKMTTQERMAEAIRGADGVRLMYRTPEGVYA